MPQRRREAVMTVTRHPSLLVEAVEDVVEDDGGGRLRPRGGGAAADRRWDHQGRKGTLLLLAEVEALHRGPVREAA